MFTAIFGLVGVIIGGLIAGLSSFLIERRRDQKVDEREGKARLQLLKRAARVVDADLEQAETSARFAVKDRKWWPEEMGRLEVTSWAEHREILASELSNEDWKTIVLGFGFIHGLNNARALAAKTDPFSPNHPEMTQDDQNRIPFGINGIAKARACIANVLSRITYELQKEKGRAGELPEIMSQR